MRDRVYITLFSVCQGIDLPGYRSVRTWVCQGMGYWQMGVTMYGRVPFLEGLFERWGEVVLLGRHGRGWGRKLRPMPMSRTRMTRLRWILLLSASRGECILISAEKSWVPCLGVRMLFWNSQYGVIWVSHASIRAREIFVTASYKGEVKCDYLAGWGDVFIHLCRGGSRQGEGGDPFICFL